MAVHMRYDYPEKAKETLEEILSLGKETGVRIEISHLAANLYGNGIISWADQAIRDSQCSVACDMYPYNVWATSLQSAVFDEGFDHFNFTVEDLEILSGEHAGEYCSEKLFAELRKKQENIKIACHNAMPPEDVEAAYRLPYCMMGSDGQFHRDESGLFRLASPRVMGIPCRPCCCCVGNYPEAVYDVAFHANISVPGTPTAGTVEEIQLAIFIDGEEDPSSIMSFTPAAVDEFGNVGANILVSVPCICGCSSVSVRNISTQPVNVRNANIVFDFAGIRR